MKWLRKCHDRNNVVRNVYFITRFISCWLLWSYFWVRSRTGCSSDNRLSRGPWCHTSCWLRVWTANANANILRFKADFRFFFPPWKPVTLKHCHELEAGAVCLFFITCHLCAKQVSKLEWIVLHHSTATTPSQTNPNHSALYEGQVIPDNSG